MADKRDALADYLDRRITITGTFEKFDLQIFGVEVFRVWWG
jgi:hypothetical protein